MNIYDSLFSSNDMLNEQIAGLLNDFVSAEGPFMAIRDARGNCWLSDEDRLSDEDLISIIVPAIGNALSELKEDYTLDPKDLTLAKLIDVAKRHNVRSNAGLAQIMRIISKDGRLSELDVISDKIDLLKEVDATLLNQISVSRFVDMLKVEETRKEIMELKKELDRVEIEQDRKELEDILKNSISKEIEIHRLPLDEGLKREILDRLSIRD